MDRKIRYFVNGWSFRLSFATRPGYDGDHEDISDGDSYELGEYENSEEALAAAEAFISTHGNEVNDEEDGIGSVIYWTVEVERRVEYKDRKRLPSRTWDGAGGHGEPEAVGTRYPFRHGSSAHKNRFREAMRMDDCGSEKTIHYEEEGTQDGAKA